jgi:UDP-N-acetylglucosamine--N-acetylmuramyl-(pentapeptide) pyrophosphoryl-undecaprenol N-acetylglucosamine transferase
MLNKIIFAAGGTGGHIYPAIAVANELRILNDKIEILFIGAKGRIEEKIVPASGYQLKTIELRGFYRSINPKNVLVTLSFLKAVRKSNLYLKEFRPEIVFGTGGFVSGPVLWEARKLHIPTVIQEGNSYPGITVKWLSPKVDKVILNFEETRKYLKRHNNIEMFSYPVRANLKRYSKEEAGKYFDLSADKKTLFVLGGSQGAVTLNNAVLKYFRELVDNDIQIIWQTGDKFYETIPEKVKMYKSIKILKYIDNIDYAYSAADLIVCRSGISTVMELASFGCAAVFVPFSHATENHQEKNARTLVDKQAAEIILDKELAGDFLKTILSVIKDDKKLSEMRNNIAQFADKGAAKKIALSLIEMVNTSKN